MKRSPVILAAAVGLAAGCAPEPTRVVARGTLEPGEKYLCQRTNISEEMYVRRYAASESGTVLHHGILMLGPQTEPEGLEECGYAVEISQDWTFLFGSSPAALDLPEGVAFKIDAGSQFILQVHLVNANLEPEEYEVAIDVETVPPEEVEAEAQVTMMGTVNFTVPPGDSTSSGFCHLDSSAEVFAVLPHMHARGHHFAMSGHDGGEVTTLVDEPFSQDQQEFVSFDPIPFSADAEFRMDCTFKNPGEKTYRNGPTADDEMCYGITYFYPANPNIGPFCSTGSRLNPDAGG